MKKSIETGTMKILGILVLVFVSPLRAGWISLTSNEPADPTVTVLSASDNQTIMEIEIPGFWSDDTLISTDSMIYQILALPGHYAYMDYIGRPMLPTLGWGIVIPLVNNSHDGWPRGPQGRGAGAGEPGGRGTHLCCGYRRYHLAITPSGQHAVARRGRLHGRMPLLIVVRAWES